MTPILTSAEMRALEHHAFETGLASPEALMQRAGQAVAALTLATWPTLAPRTALVLCGPGNNGGDGYVAALELKRRGWQVDVIAWGDEGRLSPEAAAARKAWAVEGPILELPKEPVRPALLPERSAALVVDAVFGVGLNRYPEAVEPLFARYLGPGRSSRVVAVDVPSTLSADTGLVPPRATGAPGRGYPADLTVTFHAPKLGHLIGEGPDLCGELAVADIGLPDAWPLDLPTPILEARPEPALLRKPQGHKYDHGAVLILAGGHGRGGAARLAARAALRVGAGLVTLACPPEAMLENAAQLEAVMLRPLANAEDLAALMADRRLSSLCLGPGLGLGAREEALVATALEGTKARDADKGTACACILDADALTLLARSPALCAKLHPHAVLTPHGGEFARLCPDLAADERLTPVDRAARAAERFGCTVLLKGRTTAIADASGARWLSAAVYRRAVPWLATAGAGDVLAGMIAGLCARGLPPTLAAAQAAALHVEAALSFGPGLIAEDLPATLPHVFRALGL